MSTKYLTYHAIYGVLSIAFVGLAVKADQNVTEFYSNENSGIYYQSSEAFIGSFEDGGMFSTENATYEMHIDKKSDDSITSGYKNFSAFGEYNGNRVVIDDQATSMYGTIHYPNGATLSVSTNDEDKMGNKITYSDTYNSTTCIIVVDDNLEQLDDNNVDVCYDLFSMEDAQYLYDEMMYINENYEY